jgi:hypothetical protein
VRRLLCIVLVSGAAALSACSSSGGAGNGALPPKQLADKALGALRSASAFHVFGSMTDKGETMKIDLHLGSNGSKGTLTVKGQTVELLSVGGTAYFRAPDSFYEQMVPANQRATVIRVLHGKWVKVSASSSEFSDFAGLASKDSFVKGIADNGKSDKLTKGSDKTVDGVSTVGVVDAKEKTTVYIKKHGTPYPIEVDEGSKGSLHFDDFNKSVSASAPPASQVIDLSQFGGG